MLSTHLKNMLVKLDLFPKNRSKMVNKKKMFQTNHTLVKLEHFPAGFKPTEMILNAHPLPSDSSSNSAPGPANKEPANCAVFIVLLIADTFPKRHLRSAPLGGIIHQNSQGFLFLKNPQLEIFEFWVYYNQNFNSQNMLKVRRLVFFCILGVLNQIFNTFIQDFNASLLRGNHPWPSHTTSLMTLGCHHSPYV